MGTTTVPLREGAAGDDLCRQLPTCRRRCSRFRHPDEQKVKRDAAPQIAYPGDGVDVDLGLKAGDASPLIVKVRNGVPPFTLLLANGAPFGRTAFARQETLVPDGPGFVTLSVVDAEGALGQREACF